MYWAAEPFCEAEEYGAVVSAYEKMWSLRYSADTNRKERIDMEQMNHLEQMKEMMAQEYTILHHSVLTDQYVKDRFVSAVTQAGDRAEFEKLIDLLLEFNEAIRKNGFFHYLVLKDKLDNKVFHTMADLLCQSTNLLKIKALLTPTFWFLSGDELVQSVLIHDAVQMTVLGHTNEEMKLALCGMIGL